MSPFLNAAPLSRRLFCLVSAFLLAASFSAEAQDVQPPAHLAVVDGTVMLAHDTQLESAASGVPIIPGDRLETTAGRAEVMFADGSTLDIDESSSVEVQADGLLRLNRGRVLLSVAGTGYPRTGAPYQVDAPVASAQTSGPGEFRVTLLPDQTTAAGVEVELAVARGAARLSTERGSTTLRGGERALARENEAPSFAQAFNSARFDAFDRWALALRDERTGGALSAQYLPSDLRMYGGELDRYGTWGYEAPYGYVWYPAVASAWQPYYDGYWASVAPYGWTWVGFDVWSWPTHHYGRWGFARNRWFWMPDRRWGPAWVSWAAAPGYVSWCPLGLDNRPVFGLSITTASAFGSGWVVVPRQSFGAAARVSTYAVNLHHVGAATPFVVQSTPPVGVGRAIARHVYTAQAAIPRGAASADSRIQEFRAVPRGASPESRQPLADRNRSAYGDAMRTPRVQPMPDVPRAPANAAASPRFGTATPVPNWSAPSTGVPRTITPVPNWSAPSVGVPRWSAPSIGVPPAAPQVMNPYRAVPRASAPQGPPPASTAPAPARESGAAPGVRAHHEGGSGERANRR